MVEGFGEDGGGWEGAKVGFCKLWCWGVLVRCLILRSFTACKQVSIRGRSNQAHAIMFQLICVEKNKKLFDEVTEHQAFIYSCVGSVTWQPCEAVNIL